MESITQGMSSGLAALLKGKRTLKLPELGIKLRGRKLTFNDFTAIEQIIIEKRLNFRQSINLLEEALAGIKDPKVAAGLLESAKTAISDLLVCPHFARMSEAIDFETSREGMAWYLYLSCKGLNKKYINSYRDAFVIVQWAKDLDSQEIQAHLEWATSAEAINFSEAPVPSQGQEKNQNTDGTNGGQSSPDSLNLDISKMKLEE